MTKAWLLGLALAALVPAVAAGDALDPVGTVNAFDQAIAKGDEVRAKDLLAPDVLIYESGGQEASRDEYAAHHLGADIEFMAHVQRKVIDRKQGSSGELAWVATRSRITGNHNGKAVDLFSTETLVLRRQADGWRIVHIQWSSQRAQPKAP